MIPLPATTELDQLLAELRAEMPDCDAPLPDIDELGAEVEATLGPLPHEQPFPAFPDLDATLHPTEPPAAEPLAAEPIANMMSLDDLVELPPTPVEVLAKWSPEFSRPPPPRGTETAWVPACMVERPDATTAPGVERSKSRRVEFLTDMRRAAGVASAERPTIKINKLAKEHPALELLVRWFKRLNRTELNKRYAIRRARRGARKIAGHGRH